MNSPAPVTRKKTTAWEMYRSIVGIGAFCALLLVGVFKATEARIAENKARFLAAAVSQVLPASQTTVEVTKDAEGRLVAATLPSTLPVFLGYDEGGELVGAVITSQAMGYADLVTVLFSYSFENQAIVGFKVLESKETPGLGDKIFKDQAFVDQFFARPQTPLAAIKAGSGKGQPGEIDAITGATISSKVVVSIINNGIAEWHPVLLQGIPEEAP